MCHGDNRIVLERGANRLLHRLVRLNVKVTCRLVEKNDLVLPQKSAGESEELGLTLRELVAACSQRLVELFLERADDVFELWIEKVKLVN